MGSGPSYPYIDLERAVDFAQKIHDYAKKASAPASAVITDAWGFSLKNSRGGRVVAALRNYGLVEEIANAKGKLLTLTHRAFVILLSDENAPERLEELKSAALAPELYEYCWRTWGRDMPASMKSNLLIQRGFTEQTVKDFVCNYKKTVEYANLLEKDSADQADETSHLCDGKFMSNDTMQDEATTATISSFTEERRPTLAGENVSSGNTLRELRPVSRLVHSLTTLDSGVVQDSLTLLEGSILIQRPAKMSTESCQAFMEFAAIVYKQMERSPYGPNAGESSK